jgi:hypothetical protein
LTRSTQDAWQWPKGDDYARAAIFFEQTVCSEVTDILLGTRKHRHATVRQIVSFAAGANGRNSCKRF